MYNKYISFMFTLFKGIYNPVCMRIFAYANFKQKGTSLYGENLLTRTTRALFGKLSATHSVALCLPLLYIGARSVE